MRWDLFYRRSENAMLDELNNPILDELNNQILAP